MADSGDEQLREWQYHHFVRNEWDSDNPINRFALQVENTVEKLQETEDLEPPFSIEADIRIVSKTDTDR